MIKVKRIFTAMLAVTLLAGLCGCGENIGENAGGGEITVSARPTAPDSTVPTDSAAPADISTPVPTEAATPEPTATPANIDIPWTDVTYSAKDSSGYTYDIILHLSPWILLSDTDLINSAWDKVSGGKILPQFDDWGFTRSGSAYKNTLMFYYDRYSPTLTWYMTDMYYSVGAVTIKNTTSGFDITQNEPRSVVFPWGQYKGLLGVAGRILYSNGDELRMNGIYLAASMTSNTWGPVPIIFMTPENISPNTPNGMAESILTDEIILKWTFPDYTVATSGTVSLESENTQVQLGILKNDGEYITQ